MTSRQTRTAASIALTVTLIAGMTAHAQPTVGRYQEFGDVRGFVNIVGPGQDGSLNATETIQAQGGTYPPYVRDQLDMYAGLVHASPGRPTTALDLPSGRPFGAARRHPASTLDRWRGSCATGHGAPHTLGVDTRRCSASYAIEDRLFPWTCAGTSVARACPSSASPGNVHMDRSRSGARAVLRPI
jgi:hypothetical protein